MGMIKANLEAEVSVGFSAVKAGNYKMRITEVTDRNPEKNDLKLKLEFVEPASNLYGVDNQPLKGNASNLFDYVMLADDKQWKLRTLTEAVGLPWGDYDPCVELVGKEVEVVVKIEVYEGEQKNKVARYVIQK
jgi:hypothetical protein